MRKQLDYDNQAKVLTALSDPTRLKIVELLAEDEMSGAALAEQLGISLALFCHHSKILSEAGVIKKRREGLIRFHSLNRACISTCITHLERFTQCGTRS